MTSTLKFKSVALLAMLATACANRNFKASRPVLAAADVKPCYSPNACAGCAENLIQQLQQLPAEASDGVVLRFQQPAKRFTLRRHAQGIARLNDNRLRFAITRHSTRHAAEAGVYLVEWPDDYKSVNHADLRAQGHVQAFFSMRNNLHTGGCQLLGDTLAVAHYSPTVDAPARGWISFYDVSGADSIREVNRLYLSGKDDYNNTYPLGKFKGPTSVGVTQLANGWQLLLAFEARHVLKYNTGWLFVNRTGSLANAKWEFVKFWHELDAQLPGAMPIYENINLMNDCATGEIFLLGFYGKRWRNQLDAYRLDINNTGDIQFVKIFSKHINTKGTGASFRAGGSVFVTANGEIKVYAVEKNSHKPWMTIAAFSAKQVKE